MDMLSNVKFRLKLAPGIGQKIAVLELRINHSLFEDRVHVRVVKCTQRCACETQTAAFEMLPLRAGSPGSRHRQSTTIVSNGGGIVSITLYNGEPFARTSKWLFSLS